MAGALVMAFVGERDVAGRTCADLTWLGSGLKFLALWGGSTAYLGATGADWAFAGSSRSGIFGIGLSAIAWLTTRGAKTEPIAGR